MRSACRRTSAGALVGSGRRWLALSGAAGVTLGIPVAMLGYNESSDAVLQVGVGSFFVGGGMLGAGVCVGATGQWLKRRALVDAGYQSHPNIVRTSRVMMLGGLGSIVVSAKTGVAGLTALGSTAIVGGVFVRSIEGFRVASVIQRYDLSMAPVLLPDEKGLQLTMHF